jgi:hypothetical protein
MSRTERRALERRVRAGQLEIPLGRLGGVHAPDSVVPQSEAAKTFIAQG